VCDGLTPGCGAGPWMLLGGVWRLRRGLGEMEGNHIHLFIQYPLKYSVSFIAKRLKGRTSGILRQEFPELKGWCKKVSGHQAAIMEVLGIAGKLLRNISPDKIENRDAEYYKQALDLSPGYR